MMAMIEMNERSYDGKYKFNEKLSAVLSDSELGFESCPRHICPYALSIIATHPAVFVNTSVILLWISFIHLRQKHVRPRRKTWAIKISHGIRIQVRSRGYTWRPSTQNRHSTKIKYI
jgi:hypothetical protein